MCEHVDKRRNKNQPKYIWLKVTQDKYEHIVEMAETAKELADKLGVTENSIRLGVKYYYDLKMKTKYRKVLDDEYK